MLQKKKKKKTGVFNPFCSVSFYRIQMSGSIPQLISFMRAHPEACSAVAAHFEYVSPATVRPSHGLYVFSLDGAMCTYRGISSAGLDLFCYTSQQTCSSFCAFSPIISGNYYLHVFFVRDSNTVCELKYAHKSLFTRQRR